MKRKKFVKWLERQRAGVSFDPFWHWLAFKLPWRLVYWCAIRVWAQSTSGRWEHEENHAHIPIDCAIRRFEVGKGKLVEREALLQEEKNTYLEILADCWSQWCYRGTVDGKEAWTDGGLSTLEDVRAVLVQAGLICSETGKPVPKEEV